MTATIALSDEEIRIAERTRWRFAVESLDAGDLADDLDYWARMHALWTADLAAGDFTSCDAAALRGGIAYAAHKLNDLTRHAKRLTRALPAGSPASQPRADLAPRFAAARYADCVALIETLTGQTATKAGNGRCRARCPFHKDDSPSLVIYGPGKGWYCFVCQKGGDAVAFAGELMQCGAGEALELVERLADTYPAAWGAA